MEALKFQRPVWLASGLALLLSVTGVLCQGTFRNLDFELSTVVGPSAPAIALVSDWTAYGGWGVSNYSGGMALIYNSETLDAANASLVGVDYYRPAIQGNYSIFLKGGGTYYPYGPVPWTNGSSIGQTASIPATAQSLSYWGASWNSLRVTFNGHVISFSPIQSNANYVVYGADISAYAGQTGELLLNAPWPNAAAMIDQIQFSNLPVPEPSVFGLSALSALLLGCRVLGRRRCQRN